MRSFWGNPIVTAALASWFLAQFVKALVILLSAGKRGKRAVLIALMWRTGGMPSSHAAIVTSMCTVVGVTRGPGSDLFAIVFFFAAIVLRDAMGVRRSSGQQARTLNTLGRDASERLGLEFHPVKEVQGHTPIEVVAGGLLGIFVAGAVCFL